MFIFISMILSFGLCVTGIILSVIDVNRYNFGLYLSLLSIVTFTVAIACLVVKPTLCRGPMCLTKFLRRRFSSSHHPTDYVRGNESNQSFRRLLVCRKKNPSVTAATVGCGDAIHSVVDESNVEESKNSTSEVNQQQLTPKKIRFVDEVDMKHDKAVRRARAYTAPSSGSKKEMLLNDNKSVKEWQRLIIRHDTNLLLHAAFPLCERGPLSPNLGGVSKKSYSTEEVVDLKAFCRPESLNLINRNSPLVFSRSTMMNSQNGPIDKHNCNKSEENTKLNSPRQRAHTIVVKYVPVRKEWLDKRKEWLRKASSPSSTSSDYERERSHSSFGVSSERKINSAKSNQLTVNNKTKYFPHNIFHQMDPFKRLSSSHTETFL